MPELNPNLSYFHKEICVTIIIQRRGFSSDSRLLQLTPSMAAGYSCESLRGSGTLSSATTLECNWGNVGLGVVLQAGNTTSKELYAK